MNRVIFIDDDVLFLRSLKRSLRAKQAVWEMHFFSGAAPALAQAERGEDAVFVVDWLLPDSDGLDLARTLRRTNAARGGLSYVVMLTARQDRKAAVVALESGADDYLVKPVEPDELAARITVGLRFVVNERRLKEEPSQRLASAMRASPDGIMITDDRGRIVDVNPAGLRLCRIKDKGSVIGQRAIDFIVPEDRDTALEQFSALVRTGTITSFGCHLRVGRRRASVPVEMSAALVTGPDGRPEGFVGIARDITERRQAEDVRRRLVEKVIAAQDEERRLIARELHDETGQWISSLIAGLTALEDSSVDRRTKKRARELRHLSVMALSEIRRISKGLHPSVLDHMGLSSALRQYARDFSKAHGIRVEIQLVGFKSQKRLPGAL